MWFRNIFRRAKAVDGGRGESAAGGQEQVALSPRAVRQLNRLHLGTGRYLPGSSIGQRSSLRRKPAYDFREHRKYVPGDDVRFVDWKASARQEQIFIKQGEHPKEATVHLLLDCSASMTWGAPPKTAVARQVAAILGFAALSHGDRLLVQPLGGDGEQLPFGPTTGKGQIPALLTYLRDLRFGGETHLLQGVRAFKHQARNGLLLLLSDLLGVDDPAPLLQLLPPPTWDVILFHLLHPRELAPELQGDFEMVDIESGRSANYDVDEEALVAYRAHLDAWCERLDAACTENGAFYTLLPTDWTPGGQVIPHLRSLNVLVPL